VPKIVTDNTIFLWTQDLLEAWDEGNFAAGAAMGSAGFIGLGANTYGTDFDAKVEEGARQFNNIQGITELQEQDLSFYLGSVGDTITIPVAGKEDEMVELNEKGKIHWQTLVNIGVNDEVFDLMINPKFRKLPSEDQIEVLKNVIAKTKRDARSLMARNVFADRAMYEKQPGDESFVQKILNREDERVPAR
jgi:hypothetical protein